MTIQDKLKALIDEGLEFGDCVNAFGVDERNPFAKAADEMYSREGAVEIDSPTVLSESDEGAYVLAWVWVSNSDAGELPNSELLQEMLGVVQESGNGEPLLKIYCDWLEDLISNFSDELDGIEHEKVDGLPGPISWIDESEVVHEFLPSVALKDLAEMSRLNGLDSVIHAKATEFILTHGNKLDAVIKTACLSLEERTESNLHAQAMDDEIKKHCLSAGRADVLELYERMKTEPSLRIWEQLRSCVVSKKCDTSLKTLWNLVLHLAQEKAPQLLQFDKDLMSSVPPLSLVREAMMKGAFV